MGKKSSRGEEDSRQERLEKIEERREGGGIKERFPKVKKKKRERDEEDGSSTEELKM